MSTSRKRVSAEGAMATSGRPVSVAKRQNYQKRASLYRSLSGFPKKMEIKLRWVENFQIPLSGTTIESRSFRANGMRHIFGTSTHQPLYFDKLMDIYNHYIVMQSGVKFTISRRDDDGTANNGTVLAACYLNDDSAVVPTNVTYAMEQSTGKALQVAALQSRNTRYITSYYNAKSTFGKAPSSDDALRGDAAADPVETTYFTLCLQNVVSQAPVIDVLIEIEYLATFFELKDVNS